MAGKPEVTPEQYELVRTILGQDAETFRRTKLGQYIYDRIESDEVQLIEELIEASLVSSDLDMTRRGLTIQMARMLPRFIDEAVASGHRASDNIDQMASKSLDY